MKVEKGITQRLSPDKLRTGKTMQEITLSRELKGTTICSHLSGFIEKDELSLNEIRSPLIISHLESALQNFSNDSKLGEIFSVLSCQFAAEETVLGVAWKKYNSRK